MTCYGIEIENRLKSLGSDAEALHLMRFFKTGPGEYGEGDKFLGVRVPVTRSVVKEYRECVNIDDVKSLVSSQWHEVRLAGFLLLIEIYNRCKKLNDKSDKCIVEMYLSMLDYGNNWDLVDLVAPKILGDYIVSHQSEQIILDRLAVMSGCLWRQRVAVVANWMIIRSGSYESTFRIVEMMLSHPHDLIHKACGWMLREVGKRGGMDLMLEFLNRYANRMPRTMLRYAIERLPESQRRRYLKVR